MIAKTTYYNKRACVLPVECNKYYSRTYFRTGQPYRGLGQWLLYQERKLKGANTNANY